MEKRKLGRTGLDVAPVVLGGNVFGWTIDEKASFGVLDAFADKGFNAVDTADAYSAWHPGNTGGESETIIGKWLRSRPEQRRKTVIMTKVGSDMGAPGRKGLSERWIVQAVEDSLRRLGTDYIDLYFSHWPDAETPVEETLGAYAKLLQAGKVRAIGASNLDAPQLSEALGSAAENKLPAYQVLQPQYNLYDRDSFEGPLSDLCQEKGLGVVTYFSLASGFLTGKYRSNDDLGQSARGEDVASYLTPRGDSILAALDAVATRHQSRPAEVALAWLMSRPGVTAPIASATRPEQVNSFVKAASLHLTAEDLSKLDKASGTLTG